MGSYYQGGTTEADRTTRIDTDWVASTVNNFSMTEVNVRPKTGAAYNSKSWAVGTSTADTCDFNSAQFYGAVYEYGVTYAAVYVYNSGAALSSKYLGIGSDDGCKVWWNGTVVDQFIGGRGTSVDANFWGPITINAGWNFLMVKVENGGTGHGVYARFANANRTGITSGLSTYTSDATAPSAPSSLAVSGISSDVWQNTVGTPTFTWTAGTDSQGSGEGVSGVRGYRRYFGTSSTGTPTTAQTSTSRTEAAQTSTTKYFRVTTVDYALNESGVTTFIYKFDNTPPTGVSMGFGTITSDSIAVTGAGTDDHSGVDASSGYNYSRDGAGDSGWQGATHTWSGLTANTEYTGLTVTARDQVVTGTPNMAASSAQSQWTLSVAPGAGSVTPDNGTVCCDETVTWTAVGGFGAGKIQKYKFAWTQSDTHTWTGSETDWSTGTIQTTPTSEGTWYLHVKGYNGANVENGTYAYSVTANALPTGDNKGVVRFAGGGTVKIPIASLNASEAIASLGTPAHGSVSKNDTWIFYVPTAGDNNNDSFTYTTAGNSYGCTRTATISVTVADSLGSAKEIAYAAGGVTVTFVAIPTLRYDIARASSTDGTYSTVHSFTMDADGEYSWTDTEPINPQGYYKLKYPGTPQP